MRILFVGDIMPGGVLPYQDNYIDGRLLDYLKGFDLRIGTLECGLGTDLPFDERKMNSFKSIVYSRDEDLKRVIEMGFDVVSLANNHALDLGIEGLQHTIELLDRNGIKHFGAGMNVSEAKKPVVLHNGKETLALIGCMFDYRVPYVLYTATEEEPGVYHTDITEITSYIKELKNQYDKVIVMPHWAEEHKYLQVGLFKDYAKRMFKAGADCIIGSHPHIINPVVSFGGRKCFFSLGNFLFPDKCMQVPRPMYYPDTAEECHSLKRMWTYPKQISEPIVAVWKPKNRIGMMVEMQVSGRIKTKYNFVFLNKDNVLSRYESILIRLRMLFWALLMKMPGYDILRKYYLHPYNLLRRAMDKLPSFNIPVKL